MAVGTVRVWDMHGNSYVTTPEAVMWASQQPLCSCDGCGACVRDTWAKISYATWAQTGMVSGSLAILLIEGLWGRHLENSVAWTAVFVSSLVAQGGLILGTGCIPSPPSSGNGGCRHVGKVCGIILEGTLTFATVMSGLNRS